MASDLGRTVKHEENPGDFRGAAAGPHFEFRAAAFLDPTSGFRRGLSERANVEHLSNEALVRSV